jgi:mannose-1-phosphate guanylyltransferase
MRAMILAAGQGTRLLPLTRVRPKVLSPVVGITMLEFWIHQLHQAGCEAVVVNAFHLHEKMVAAVEERTWPIPVQVLVEPLLLGTGGGLRNALDFFEDEPFVALNGDMLCNAPFQELYRQHLRSGRLVSLLMHDWPRFNNVAVGEDGQILGFGGEADRLPPSGIHRNSLPPPGGFGRQSAPRTFGYPLHLSTAHR